MSPETFLLLVAAAFAAGFVDAIAGGGARLGAAFAMRFGARLIRPLLVAVCLALAARLPLS